MAPSWPTLPLHNLLQTVWKPVGHANGFLKPSEGAHGMILGTLGALLGRSWNSLGRFWDALGTRLEELSRAFFWLDQKKTLAKGSGDALGNSLATLGTLLGLLERSWDAWGLGPLAC